MSAINEEGEGLSSPRRPTHSPTLLRKGIPGERKPLKEKLITYYEQLFKGEDPSQGNPRFWEEFFLLKVNIQYFQTTMSEMKTWELISLKKSLSLLFVQCCTTLQLDDNVIRNINALQTLCVLLRSTFDKKLSDSSFDVIDVVIGFDSAECQMRNLVEALNKFLVHDYPASLKNLCLRLLLVMLTAMDNISQNMLLEYVMMNSVFETIMHLLSVPDLRDQHGYDAVVVLTLLVNYRKYEAANPYVIKLSVLDDEIALHGLGSVVSSVLTEYNKKYVPPTEEPVGIFGHISSFVSNMLVPVDTSQTRVKIDMAVLLVLYEAIHLNRNFITVLTHTKSLSNPVTPTTPNPAIDRSLPLPSSPTTPAGKQPTGLPQPTNLLGTFFTFSSIILQNIKDDSSVTHARLCLVIITCIVEDQFANSFLHDPNMTFPVTLHRASLLHRKPTKDGLSHVRPLACSLLDLMVEFMISHMAKNFKLDLYRSI
ncbi:Armadillo-like helical domain-containing protein 3 [Geodia barretti]|uniref:Armadillo-like helical domain-containing protein 3 n=1 Tax=Geodia barretti TaxID=519541 RepID=A0AA35TLQ3_GEOBA|nr:Armadillo-like helical domain-containing protein 3 [Geodia barretti]